MIRYLKVLGLALLAILAFNAIAASGASAQQGKLTSDGPVTLKATETGEGANFWTVFNLKTICPGTTYTGHKVLSHAETTEGKKHELIPPGATTWTVTPHYKQDNHNCKVMNFPATIHMNGCDFVFHIGITTGGIGDTYGLTMDIVCPPGKEITKTLWTTTEDHTNNPNNPFCVIHIPPQLGLAGPHVTDTTNGHLDLTGAFQGIKATRTASPTHPLLCPAGSTEAGKFEVDLTVSGSNSLGAPTPVSLSE